MMKIYSPISLRNLFAYTASDLFDRSDLFDLTDTFDQTELMIALISLICLG